MNCLFCCLLRLNSGLQLDQTYYVIDMVCWRGYSLYDCTAEFRFFWLNSKLEESGACAPPSRFHKFRFSPVLVYNCDQSGLLVAYTGAVPYVKDGLLFCNKYVLTSLFSFQALLFITYILFHWWWLHALLSRHAHYQTGNTPLALVWKDENCSQYVIDTDNKGQVLSQQQVYLQSLDSLVCFPFHSPVKLLLSQLH